MGQLPVPTIAEVEFPSVYAEKDVNINAEQLYARCQNNDHLEWYGPVYGEDNYYFGSGESQTVQLDNSGNAFVVLWG
jgi:hypothetical protein